jgi:elongation factor G
MEKYLEGEELTKQKLDAGIKAGCLAMNITPMTLWYII